MTELTYKLKDFEGPLDLLLHLLSRNRMRLFDIRIYELIDQYLDFIGEIGPEELDPTSEFIEMAARLVHMKTVALLPRTEETEELERTLTGQLIEYGLCKLAASKLRDRSEGVNYFVRLPMAIELPNDYDRMHEPGELCAAYLLLQGRARRKTDVSEFEPLVTAPVVSVESRVIKIMSTLSFSGSRHVSEFFADTAGRSETVATFLGILELVKGGNIEIDGDGYVSVKNREIGELEEDDG